MRFNISIILLSVLLATGCGKSTQTAGGASAATPSVSASTGNTATTASAGSSQIADRKKELVNPSQLAMLFLYYDLASIKAPVDEMVEDDSRVAYAPAPDKEAQRKIVRDELAFAAASVQGVGKLRFSLGDANLSEYDPTYKEFTVGAFSPSSILTFATPKLTVNLSYGNANKARIWSVAPEEAKVIRDKVGKYGHASMDFQVNITGVQPGGSIISDVVEYELRSADYNGGATLVRVHL